jgi:hypothetical protein
MGIGIGGEAVGLGGGGGGGGCGGGGGGGSTCISIGPPASNGGRSHESSDSSGFGGGGGSDAAVGSGRANASGRFGMAPVGGNGSACAISRGGIGPDGMKADEGGGGGTLGETKAEGGGTCGSSLSSRRTRAASLLTRPWTLSGTPGTARHAGREPNQSRAISTAAMM